MFENTFRVVLATMVMTAATASRPASLLQNDTSPIVVAITPERSDLVLHVPLNLVLTMRNNSPEAAEINLGSDRKSAITVESQLPDGTEKVGHIRVHESASRRGQITLASGQSYSQNLIINRWTDFRVPGIYRVVVLLDNPIKMQNGSTVKLGPIAVIAVVGERNDAALQGFCEDALKKLLMADSYGAAANAAEILSYVQDPIAVPYLRQAFQTPYPVHSQLVDGLERIGSDDAIEVLLQMVGKKPTSESGYLKNALDQLAAKTRDPNLRWRIRIALEDK